jgi:hypothetical protein
MPLYEWRCPLGCQVETFMTLASHELLKNDYLCPKHYQVMEQVIGAPILVAAQPECRYDSPIDGRPITTHHARQEDLKRNGCIPYDPEQKTDAERRRKDSEQRLDKAIDATVEEAVSKMTTKQRAKLHSELVEQGTTADVIRRTV